MKPSPRAIPHSGPIPTEPNRFHPLTDTICWIACLLVIGCGDGRPARVPVSGLVLIDGQPLTHGFVRFVPEGQRRVSTGRLDDSGRFVLACFEEHDGALLGNHRVEIHAVEAVDAQEEHLRWHAPKKYSNWSTSGIEAEITAPTNDLVIELSWEGGQPFIE